MKALALCLTILITQESQAGFLFWRSKPAPEPPVPASPQKSAPQKSSRPTTDPSKGGQKGPASSPSPARQPLQSLPKEQLDRNVQLQVFLDQNLFSPKKIDGRGGPETLKAINAFLKSQNASPITDEKLFAPPKLAPILAKFSLDQKHLRFIANFGNQRYGIPYNSKSEFICERFHCSEELLTTLNPGVKLNALQPGEEIIVPSVEPFQIEDVQPTAAIPENEERRGREIRVDLTDRSLAVINDSTIIAVFPVAIGSPGLPTPKGKWRITGICILPTYRWDQGVLSRGVRTDNFKMMPPGPNNPVGVVWCGLNKPGLGIHGTNNPESIGSAASHGCIRLANWDAIRLTELINPGTPVIIN